MIKGVHTMFYSSDATGLRKFLRDKLGFMARDVGDGWLIFNLPEADMGCHPADEDHGYGFVTHFQVPGDFYVQSYQPKYDK